MWMKSGKLSDYETFCNLIFHQVPDGSSVHELGHLGIV